MEQDAESKVAEKLDVEDEEQRQARIQAYLEKLNSTSQTRAFSQPDTLPKFDFGDGTTFPVKPPTELLSRVRAFLPEIEASNEALSQRAHADPDSVNIEHLSEGMEQYIEMNLGLGVFEDRSARQSGNTESSDSMSTSSESSDSESHHEAQDDDDDSDAESDESSEIITSFVPSRPVKPLPRRASNKSPAKIVVLNESNET